MKALCSSLKLVQALNPLSHLVQEERSLLFHSPRNDENSGPLQLEGTPGGALLSLACHLSLRTRCDHSSPSRHWNAMMQVPVACLNGLYPPCFGRTFCLSPNCPYCSSIHAS